MSPLVIALLVSACVVAASLNVHHNTTSIEASLRDQTFIFEDFADAKKFHDRWIPSRHKDYENQPYVIKVRDRSTCTLPLTYLIVQLASCEPCRRL